MGIPCIDAYRYLLLNENDILITVVSFGAGQESMWLLDKLCWEPEFRKIHAPGKLLVVGSDTGEEHPHTLKAVEYAKLLCKRFGIEFQWVTPDMGFHPNNWQTLSGQYKRNSTIGSAAFIQTCTANLKVTVVNNYTEHWLQQMGYDGGNKKSYYLAAAEHGKLRLILGFAKGEEHRTTNGDKYDPVWKKKCMERYYPLIKLGVDRQKCIDDNAVNIRLKIWPSNCMICFYQSDQEILWLYRNYPDKFKDWVGMEKAKLKKFAEKGEKNFGVYGKITLMQKLEKAQKLYGHWTDEQLNDYKFSHGHCMKSKY
jgi:hypothetical protein